MAELLLNAPQASGQTFVPVNEETTSLNLSFDISEALFEKVDDNLEIYFESNDSTIVLQDFYTVYNSENIPDFLVDNASISGEDFFAALDENLMPAAGPEANSEVQNTYRYDETNAAILASGVAALGDTAGGSEYSRQNFLGDFGSNGNNNNEDDSENDEGFVIPELPEINATITIIAPENVDENATHVEYTVRVDVAPETDLVIKFDNGDEVTIPAGQTTVTYEVEVREDNVFNDGDQIIAPEITGHEGGNYDKVNYDNSDNEVTVTDDIDPSTLTLEASKDSIEGGNITYTVRVDNAPRENLIVEVKDSAGNVYEVTIPSGSTSASITVPAPTDDVYNDSGDITASLGNIVSGGSEYEQLIVDGSTANTTVADTKDTTTIKIIAPDNVDENATSVEYTIEVDNAPETDLVIELSNGEKVTIKAGETSATFTEEVRADNAYNDTDDLIAPEITGHEGGNYEDVAYDNSDNTVKVSDDADTTTIKIIAPDNVDENATSVEYTIEVNNAPETDLVIELSNGEKVTIKAGETSATFTEEVRADNAYNDTDDLIAPTITGHEGGNYEDVAYDNSDNTVKVSDDADTTTLTINTDQNVAEEGDTLNFTLNLTDKDGKPVTAQTDMTVTITIDGVEKEVEIKAGQSSVSFETTATEQTDGEINVEIDSATGGNFENLEIDDTAIETTVENASITVDEEGLANGTNDSASSETAIWEIPAGYEIVGTDANGNPYILGKDENGNLKVSLDENVTHTTQGANDTVTRPNSVTVTLENAAGETITVDVDVTIVDDAPVISTENATINEDGTSATVDATTTDGVAQAEISVDFGADMQAAQITVPSGTGGTMELGVEWNGSEWVQIEHTEWMGSTSYKFEDNTHTITIGNVTMTSTDNQNWTVTYDAIENGRDDITLNFTDGDGDTVSHEILSNAPIIDLEGSYIVADDSALANGTGDIIDTYDVEGSIDFSLGEGSASEHSFTVNLENGDKQELIFDENGNAEVSVNGGKVIFTLNEENTSLDYTFVQSEDYTHSDKSKNDESVDVDNFNVTIADSAGNSVTSNDINISINDDGPIITTTHVGDKNENGIADVQATVKDGIAETDISVDLGADMTGATIEVVGSGSSTTPLGIQWTGTEWVQTPLSSWEGGVTISYNEDTGEHTIVIGDVTMKSTDNQNWTVSYEHSEGGREGIILEFTDADGDTVSHEVTSSVPTIEVQGSDILADDSVLEGGLESAVEGYDVTGEIDFSFGDGEASEHSFTVNVGSEAKELSFDKNGNAEVAVNGGKLVFTLNEASSSLEYTFVQSEAYDGHDDTTDSAETDKVDSFNVTVTDKAGNSVTSDNIDVSINDDGPVNQENVATTTTSDVASTFVRIEFGADDGDGKSLEFGESTFTYDEVSGKWTSENGTVEYSEDGKTVNLISTDGTELSNHDGNVLWNAKLTDVPENGSQTESIKVSDSDGDSTSFDIVATNTTEAIKDTVVGLDGSTSQVNPGENYNIAIILDTSGSMYDDGNNDIDDVGGEVVSRLGQACDALADFIVNTLHTHANSDLGGEINLLVTTFWEKTETENGGTMSADDHYNSGTSSSATYIETLNPADFAGMTSDQIYESLAKILAMNAVGVTFNSETGEFEYDENAHKELTEALKDPNKDADDAYDPLSGVDLGFHWGTEYHQGFETAAEWFEQVSQDGFINEAFLITDGKPYDSEAERTKAYNELLEAMGIEVQRDEHGNPILEADGRHKPVEGSENNIHGIGIGVGADKGTLDKYDTTEGGASIVTDSDISSIFKPEGGDIDISAVESSVAVTADGNDVLIGGIDTSILKAWIAKQTGLDADSISDSQLSEYMRNYPEWINDQELQNSTANDPDALIAGSGDDVLYGQGGEDLLIGDGNASSLETFAKELNVADSDKYSEENFAVPEDMTEAESEAFTEKVQDLVIDLVDIAQAAKAEDLEKAAKALETTTDGNDIIFGGDANADGIGGDDLILGLGGDDLLYGGEGNDLLLGGSGDDTIYGGSGDDLIIGGKGSDILFGDEGNDTFFFSEESFVNGEVDVIKDLSSGDMIDLSSFKDKGYTIEVGTADNPQDIIISKGEDIFTISTNINLTDDNIEFDMESNIINI